MHITGRAYDLPIFPQIMPEYAGIYRPNNRPKPPLDWSGVRDSKTHAKQSPLTLARFNEGLSEDTVDLLERKTVEHSRRCLELLQEG